MRLAVDRVLALGEQVVEVRDGFFQAFIELDLGLPVVQVFLGAADVGLPLQRIIGRERLVDQL